MNNQYNNRNPQDLNQIPNIYFNMNLYNENNLINENNQVFNNRFDDEFNRDDDDQPNVPLALRVEPNQDVEDNMRNVVNNMVNNVNGLNEIPQYEHIMPQPTLRNVWPNEHHHMFNQLNQPNIPVLINRSGMNVIYAFYSPRFGYIMLDIRDFNNMQYEVYQITLDHLNNWINIIEN